jgi:RNA polymerase subunit RPABC4/transcription elongation factor Spt4
MNNEETCPVCPVCGATDAYYFYVIEEEVKGCENCITKTSAMEWIAHEPDIDRLYHEWEDRQ